MESLPPTPVRTGCKGKICSFYLTIRVVVEPFARSEGLVQASAPMFLQMRIRI